MSHYSGGVADWSEGGGELVPERPLTAPTVVLAESRSHANARFRSRVTRFFDSLGERSLGWLLALWLYMILGFGLVYWIEGFITGHGLSSGGRMMGGNPADLGTAIYFSFVTALSIGYGDVTPLGVLRVLAILEGAAGLLIFGVVVSRLVGRRQERVTEEIHRLAFENRLGRVRTNLHLVLADLQAVSDLCSTGGSNPERIQARVESAIAVFTGELQAIHDLLYRPQQIPDELALESILAGLAEGLRGIRELQECSTQLLRSQSFRSSLRSIASLSNEICGNCVPRDYAPQLKTWMDRVQELARRIEV